MDLATVFVLCVMSCIIGALILFLVEYVLFVKFFKEPAVDFRHNRNLNQEFQLPDDVMNDLKSPESSTKNSVTAFNLIFQFLFYEARFSTGVRNWIYRKLTFELDDLITKTTISKFFDKFLLRDLDLGSQFPEIKTLRVDKVDLHDTEGNIESLDLVMDVQYRGNFKVSIDGHMLLGKKVFLSIKLKQLSGLVRLQFTRRPYSHWSVAFVGEPSLDMDIETLFQGRQLQSQLTGLLSNQIRKVVRRKHTLPTYKIRYRPFLGKAADFADLLAAALLAQQTQRRLNGQLEVLVSELSRLDVPSSANHVFCTLTVAPMAWVEARQLTERTLSVTLDVRMERAKNQQLGVVFKQSAEGVLIDKILPNTPAMRSLLQAGDQLLFIEDKPAVTIAQISKLLRALPKRQFVFRVRRVIAGLLQDDLGCDEAFDEYRDVDDALTAGGALSATAQRTAGRKLSAGSVGSQVLAISDLSQANTPSSSPRKSAPADSNESAAAAGLTRRPSRMALTKANTSSESFESTLATIATQASLTTVYGSVEQIISDEMIVQNSVDPVVVPQSTFGQQTEPTESDASSSSSLLMAPPADVPIFQQHTTVRALVNSLVKLGDLSQFRIEPEAKWLNICAYSRCNETDELLGYLNVSLHAVVAESSASNLWQLVKKLPLNAPHPKETSSVNPVAGLKGFEQRLCFGDVLLSFVWNAAAGTDDDVSIAGKPNATSDMPGVHDFVRTQFTRSTQCEYCGKKIWLKDAVQCGRCGMSCHKKCVKKCQAHTVCGQPSDDGTTVDPPAKPAVELRLTESEAQRPPKPTFANMTTNTSILRPNVDAGGAGVPNQNLLVPGAADGGQPQQSLAQSSKNTLTDLLAQGIKRVNSVNNLAIPGMGAMGSGQFTRSLPPSPQHTPRKQSLANNQSTNPFAVVVQTLEQLSDSAEDLRDEHIVALTEPLIGWGTVDELMGLAKTSSRSLYADLEADDRVDKINILLIRLRIALDAETTHLGHLSMGSARNLSKEAESSDAADSVDRSPTRQPRRTSGPGGAAQQSDEARRAILVGRSEERVQALSVIMLHLCTGLQYAQGVATH